MGKKAICNTNCCVPQCHSKASREQNLSFHRFPVGKRSVYVSHGVDGRAVLRNQRDEWIRLLRIGKKVSETMVVCSKHFSSSSFLQENPGNSKARKRLKRNAVPTKCLPKSSVDKTDKIMERENAAMKRAARIDKRKSLQESQKVADSEIDDFEDEALDVAKILLKLSEVEVPTSSNTAMEIVGDSSSDPKNSIPDSFPDLSRTVNYNSLTDKQLKTLTGLPNNQLLDKIIEIFITKFNFSSKSLTVKEQIILTFMRIKLNLKFAVLSIFFSVSRTTCKNMFAKVVTQLSKVLECCIYLPSTEDTQKTLPKCFSNFTKVRAVLDCTEVPVEKTKCLTCNINTFSSYKGTNTVKYLIASSPDGMVSFVSNGYGGRASDKVILSQSRFLEHLEPYVNSVMVDKGFLIKDECEEFNIGLVRPPFVKKGKLSATEAQHTRAIARARVHVERIIQRMKQFQLLQGRIPWTLVPYLDSIMIIIAAVVNLSRPIISTERF